MSSQSGIRVQTEAFDVADVIAGLGAGNPAIGAIASFIGLVRDVNDGAPVTTMTLEHYPGMTEKALQTIVADAHGRWDLTPSCWWPWPAPIAATRSRPVSSSWIFSRPGRPSGRGKKIPRGQDGWSPAAATPGQPGAGKPDPQTAYPVSASSFPNLVQSTKKVLTAASRRFMLHCTN
jgi:hypothetical protein